MGFPGYILIAAIVVTAIGAFTDYREGIIPNWLSLGALAVAPLAHGVYGYTTGGPKNGVWFAVFSLLGAVICAAIPMFLYAIGAGRGGDVKLLAAVGALCRPTIGIEAVFYSFVAAAIYSMARLAYEGKLMQTLANSAAIVINPFLPKARRRKPPKQALTWTRLGPSVLAGTVVAVLLNWSIP